MKEDRAEQLTDRYNREAREYQRLWAPVLRKASLRLIEELAGERPERIVDVATGVGFLLPDLRCAFPHASITAVDRSAGMLALASTEFPRAVMDARHLAIASENVDLVLMVFVLFHLDDPLEGLREARRVLRAEGRIGTVTWGGELESLAQLTWSECLENHGALPPDPTGQVRQGAVDAPEKMEALLQLAGFHTMRIWRGELVVTFESESLLERWTRMGASKPRFDALSPAAQTACIAEARRRLAALPPEGFEARGSIVYAVASV